MATLSYDGSTEIVQIKRKPAKRKRKLSYWQWIGIICTSILMVAAICCMLAVYHNLYEGERAALKSYGDEVAPSITEATPNLANFTVEQLKTEDGLQQLLNASQLSVRFRRYENVWEIIFFKAEWLSCEPKVVLIGKRDEARPYWMEIRAPLRPTKKTDLIQTGEKYYTIELEFGRRSFNLSEWQAETLIEAIQKVCD